MGLIREDSFYILLSYLQQIPSSFQYKGWFYNIRFVYKKLNTYVVILLTVKSLKGS